MSNTQNTADIDTAKHLRLGEDGGGNCNELEGSLTGMWRSGFSYRLMYDTITGTGNNAAQNTTTGTLLLMIPEPSTFLLVGVGLAGLAGGCKWSVLGVLRG